MTRSNRGPKSPLFATGWEKATVDGSWSQNGLRCVVLENELLRAEFFPELGAKLLRLIHKRSGTNLLWNNPKIPPCKVPNGSNYDDNFSGGWDELFPNDAPGLVAGETYPDHGELWTQTWHCETWNEGRRAVVYFRCEGPVSAVRMEKWISLDPNSNLLRFRHKLTNLASRESRFLWKLHPAFAISPWHRIDIPARTVQPVDAAWTQAGSTIPTRWPFIRDSKGKRIDIRRIPPRNGTKEFVYARGLREGWCAITDTRRRLGLALTFPKTIFTSVWLFMTYGGWRDLYTVVIEPCTAYPKDLSIAFQRGEYGRLAGRDSLEVEISAIMYEGLKSVRRVTRHGFVE